jgi:hypothetical protein
LTVTPSRTRTQSHSTAIDIPWKQALGADPTVTPYRTRHVELIDAPSRVVARRCGRIPAAAHLGRIGQVAQKVRERDLESDETIQRELRNLGRSRADSMDGHVVVEDVGAGEGLEHVTSGLGALTDECDVRAQRALDDRALRNELW